MKTKTERRKIQDFIEAIKNGKTPLRTCFSIHICFLCNHQIKYGERYYDRGFGRRAHQSCIEEKMGQAYLSACHKRQEEIDRLTTALQKARVKHYKEFIKENYPSDHWDLVMRVKALEEGIKEAINLLQINLETNRGKVSEILKKLLGE